MDAHDSTNRDDGFNLSIEEVRIIAKFRDLAPHQQKGILQAIELLKPSWPKTKSRRRAAAYGRFATP
jgi:hypothetical protein